MEWNIGMCGIPAQLALTDSDLARLLGSYLDDLGDPLEAFDRVWEMSRTKPELCWRLLEVARRGDYSNEQLAVISAGPFEDLMGHHGELFIDRVELAARVDPKMRYLLVPSGGAA
jgi:hypothetical protein